MFTSDTSIYLLKINLAFVVFYLFYRLLFSRDTFFTIRRVCLLTILFLSLCYPLIPFTFGEEQKAVIQERVSQYATIFLPEVTVKPNEPALQFTATNILCWCYCLVVGVLGIRIFMQLFSIFRLIRKGKRSVCYSLSVIALPDHTTPFSFFKWIFINPTLYESHDLQEILAHEKTHVDQYHSLDVMFSELLCALFWINPAVWLLKREIRRNLEFLADKRVVASGFDRKTYQYHLLRLTCTSAAAQIVNKFNVTPLKKRIMMMNKKRTSKMGLVKYALLFPVMGLLVLSSNVQAIAHLNGERVSVMEKDSIVVKGVVVDSKDLPLERVTVIVKGTGIGTPTNAKGEFSITVKPETVLVFSYVGKETQLIKIEDTKNIRVKMQTAPLVFEEVIVTGYKVGDENVDKEGEEEVYQVVEDMPKFLGKDKDVMKFIGKTVRYPVEAQEKNIQGNVLVSFVINKRGVPTDFKIVKSVHPLLDQEAIRVLYLMPNWQPGIQGGKAVSVLCTLPINFRLQ